jgi:hypothetical protein
MSFVPIINRPGLPVVPPGPAVRLKVSRGQLIFKINRWLAADLGWQPADRVIIAFGVGDDFGRIQLSRVDSATAGHKIARLGSRGISTRATLPASVGGISKHTILQGLPQESVVLPHTIDHGTLVVTTPRLKLRVAAGAEVREVA